MVKRGTYNIRTGVYTSPSGLKSSRATPPANSKIIFHDTQRTFVSSSGGGGGGSSSSTPTTKLPQSTLKTPTEAIKPIKRQTTSAYVSSLTKQFKKATGRSPTTADLTRLNAERIRSIRKEAGVYGKGYGTARENMLLNRYYSGKGEQIIREKLPAKKYSRKVITTQRIRGQKLIDSYKSFIAKNPIVTNTLDFISLGGYTQRQIDINQAKINKKIEQFNKDFGNQSVIDSLTKKQYNEANLTYSQLTNAQKIIEARQKKLGKKTGITKEERTQLQKSAQRDILGNPLNYITGTSTGKILSLTKIQRTGKTAKVNIAFSTSDKSRSGLVKGIILSYDKGKKAFVLSTGKTAKGLELAKLLKGKGKQIFSFAQKSVTGGNPVYLRVIQKVTDKGKISFELAKVQKFKNINFQRDIGKFIVKKGKKIPVMTNRIRIKFPSGKFISVPKKTKYIRGIAFEFLQKQLINRERLSLMIGKSSKKGLFKDRKTIINIVHQLKDKANIGSKVINLKNVKLIKNKNTGLVKIVQKQKSQTKLAQAEKEALTQIMGGIAKAVTKAERRERVITGGLKATAILGSNISKFGKLISPTQATIKSGVKSISRTPKTITKTAVKEKARLNTQAIQKIKQSPKLNKKIKQQIAQISKQQTKLKQQTVPKNLSNLRLKQIQQTQLKLAQKIVPLQKTTFKISRPNIPRTPSPRIPRLPVPYAWINGKKRKITRVPTGYVLAYNVYGKTGKKFYKLNKKPLRKTDSLSRGTYAVDRTTSKQFRITPVGYYKVKDLGTALKRERGYFTKTKRKFREYRIKKGKRKVTEYKYIEKKKFFKDTKGEKKNKSLRKYKK